MEFGIKKYAKSLMKKEKSKTTESIRTLENLKKYISGNTGSENYQINKKENDEFLPKKISRNQTL